jgi:hypothetical protein
MVDDVSNEAFWGGSCVSAKHYVELPWAGRHGLLPQGNSYRGGVHTRKFVGELLEGRIDVECTCID